MNDEDLEGLIDSGGYLPEGFFELRDFIPIYGVAHCVVKLFDQAFKNGRVNVAVYERIHKRDKSKPIYTQEVDDVEYEAMSKSFARTYLRFAESSVIYIANIAVAQEVYGLLEKLW